MTSEGGHRGHRSQKMNIIQRVNKEMMHTIALSSLFTTQLIRLIQSGFMFWINTDCSSAVLVHFRYRSGLIGHSVLLQCRSGAALVPLWSGFSAN